MCKSWVTVVRRRSRDDHSELSLKYSFLSSSSDSTAFEATPLVDSETSLLLSGKVSSISCGLINPVVVAATSDLL